MDKCNNQNSEISAQIPYYEMERWTKMNKIYDENEKKISIFLLKTKVKGWIHIRSVHILFIVKERGNK